jgi:hypothetical protein
MISDIHYRSLKGREKIFGKLRSLVENKNTERTIIEDGERIFRGKRGKFSLHFLFSQIKKIKPNCKKMPKSVKYFVGFEPITLQIRTNLSHLSHSSPII